MKRTILLIIFSLCAIAAVTAQGWNRQWPQPPIGRNTPRQPVLEDVKVSGVLTIDRGMIALKSANITYLVIGLNRFIGFIDGLKEGASVVIEGRAAVIFGDNNTKFLYPQKMTLNGKEYDLSLPGGSGTCHAPILNRPSVPVTPYPMMPYGPMNGMPGTPPVPYGGSRR